MRCKTKTKAHEDKNPTMRKYHNLVPKMARVGIQIRQVTSKVLHLMAKAMIKDGKDQSSPYKVKVTPRSNPPLHSSDF